VFEQVKKGPSRDNYNAQGKTMVYKKPPPKGRQIKDVDLDCEKRAIDRPTEQAYRNMYDAVIQCFERESTPVVYAPMGWGKSTYFLIRYFLWSGKNIHVTLPSILLANNVYDSLEKAVKALNVSDKVKIGKNIDRDHT